MGKVEHIPSQNDRIVNYMQEHGGITQIEALQHLGVLRLASRISDLRRCGVDITSEFVEVKNRYGEKSRVKRYRLKCLESVNDGGLD